MSFRDEEGEEWVQCGTINDKLIIERTGSLTRRTIALDLERAWKRIQELERKMEGMVRACQDYQSRGGPGANIFVALILNELKR